jgi:hypothetical protein
VRKLSKQVSRQMSMHVEVEEEEESEEEEEEAEEESVPAVANAAAPAPKPPRLVHQRVFPANAQTAGVFDRLTGSRNTGAPRAPRQPARKQEGLRGADGRAANLAAAEALAHAGAGPSTPRKTAAFFDIDQEGEGEW